MTVQLKVGYLVITQRSSIGKPTSGKPYGSLGVQDASKLRVKLRGVRDG